MEWLSGLYGRVSTDRSEQQESIKTQKEALIQYAEQNNYKITDYYFDEGFSGTSFDRPEIKRLKRDIEDGKVNLIIVKDLSRIGRNNALTLMFLDYLSSRDVRLIAINDCYDTLRDEDDIIGIKTWYNERYSRDLSKKIKFALKHKKKKGEYLTAFAPYGYKKSSSIKNRLEVDYYAACVVKEIFDLYIRGFGFCRIAKLMDEKGIPNPSRYEPYSKVAARWNWTTIRAIISNPVYTGCSAQHKYHKKTFKSSNISRTPRDEWIWVEDTHEPIIDREVYNLAQQVMRDRRGARPSRIGLPGPHLFTSFLYCHDCGSALYYKKDRDNNGGYRCGTYVKYGTAHCTSHYIGEEELKDIICSEVREIICKYIDCSALERDILKSYSYEMGYLKKELSVLDREIDKSKQKIERLYMEKVNSALDADIFTKLHDEIYSQLLNAEKRRDDITSRITLKGRPEWEENIILLINDFLSMNIEIDREMLEWLINRIDICSNGNIIINYKFQI